MKRILLTGVLFSMLQACATSGPKPFVYGDFKSVKVLPYDSPTQVIYRIDDHRFITLERYRDCNHGDTYFNDTKTSVRTYLGRGGIENFRGKLIIADSTERNVVIPSSAPPQLNCGDRGCVVSLIYSTDGGRTFHGTDYMRAFDPLQESRRYSIYVDRNSYFVEKMRQSDSVTNRFPLLPGFVYGQDTLPDDNKIQFDVKVPVGLRSPSGQERFSCNASIRPTNPDAPLK